MKKLCPKCEGFGFTFPNPACWALRDDYWNSPHRIPCEFCKRTGEIDERPQTKA
jgi:hypothetical protein